MKIDKEQYEWLQSSITLMNNKIFRIIELLRELKLQNNVLKDTAKENGRLCFEKDIELQTIKQQTKTPHQTTR